MSSDRKVYLFKALPEDAVVTTMTSGDTFPSASTKTKDTPIFPRDLHGQTRRCDINNEGNSSDSLVTSTSTLKGGVFTDTTTSSTTTCTKDNVTITTFPKDRFITHLTTLQIESQLVPVLLFEYSNLDNLWRYLNNPSQYAGIIFTSPRCVYSCVEAIKMNGNLEKDFQRGWQGKYIFCVGPSTIAAVEQSFGWEKTDFMVSGEESHAASLSNKIVEVNRLTAFNLPLLYPCGAQRRDVLLKKLEEEGISCVECVVYESVKNPNLETLLKEIGEEIQGKNKAVLCFFSPSGVKQVLEHLDAKILDFQKIKLVAIGPTTKTAIEESFKLMGIDKEIFQCQNPTPESLVDVLDAK